MKTQKNVQTLILLLLSLCVLGIFANWAQNEYGESLINWCIFSIAILLNAKAQLELKDFKLWQIIFSISYAWFAIYLLYYFYPSYVYNLGDFFLGICIVVLLFFSLVYPFLLWVRSAQSKTREINLFSFFEAFSLSCFCIGILSKQIHLPGAGQYLASTLLLSIVYVVKGVKFSLDAIKQKNVLSLLKALLFFLMGFFLQSYVFKTQHWLGARWGYSLFYAALLILVLTVAYALFVKKENLFGWWKMQNWLSRMFFTVAIILALYYNLRDKNIAPYYYSNRFPKAYYELMAKENYYTDSGKVYSERRKLFELNFGNFIDNRKGIHTSN